MSDIAKIILWLIIAILVILASIIKLKLNPVIGLIFGSLIMGIGCNLGLVETVSNIGTGFGNLLAGIGLPIGLGVILGQAAGRKRRRAYHCRDAGKEGRRKICVICPWIRRVPSGNTSIL